MSATSENPRSRQGDRMRTFEQIEAALRASAGVVAIAAQKLNVHRQRVYDWVNADPALKQVWFEIREEMLDRAEAKLIEAINAGSEKSIHFFLDRLGHERGYGKKVALGGILNAPPIPLALPDLTGLKQSDRDELRAILERATGESEGGTPGA